MPEPTFSFITSTYQCAQFVRRCHWTLVKQSITDWEWVVVDDASTDSTREVISELKDPRIRYFRLERNAGRGVARQYALDQARGDWCAIIDMDDLCFPDRLQHVETARVAGYDFFCSMLTLIDRDYSVRGIRGFWNDTKPRQFAHASVCGKTELLKTIGYPTYRVAEDQSMVLVLANNFNGYYCDEPLYIYHEGASTGGRAAFVGNWYAFLEIWQLLRAGTLKPTAGVIKLQMGHVFRLVSLIPFLAWPRAYLWTFRFRARGSGAERALSPARLEFIRECARRFPLSPS